MAHALPQNIDINKIIFEYKLYKLCGLIGMTNYSSKSQLFMPVKYLRSYDIQIFPHPAVSCGISVGEKVFVSGCDCDLPLVDGQTGL